MSGLPVNAPRAAATRLHFADVAVTATANEFKGIYRGKQYHHADFPNTLDRALSAGVEKVILTGMSLHDVSSNLEIAKSRPAGSCFFTIGVHPYHAAEPLAEGPSYLEKLKDSVDTNLQQDRRHLAAYGEIGLDYDRLNLADKSTQLATFKAQLDMFVANQWDLPLFLHCRNSFDDFVQVMSSYVDALPRRGLVHSFVGSREQMEKLVSMNLDVSVNGFSFQTRESLDMVAAIPLAHLQIETDAPWGDLKPTSEVVKRYLTNMPTLPASKKKDKWEADSMVKERNESCTIARIAYIVAGLKGISVDEVAGAAWENSVKMFRLAES
ncbi:TatD family hydrolase [Diaporthe helianthi]|uniref:TatD family hydrolase n=1 Tax=Diaporthe helianthi TaxID=158607 RepID=A0A2P5HZ33_DIAHE|nr:TatD family hydrolase [Diaporthe helianthi]